MDFVSTEFESPEHGMVSVVGRFVPEERENGSEERWEISQACLWGTTSDVRLDESDTARALKELAAAAEALADEAPDAEPFMLDDDFGFDPYAGAYSEDC